jgi:hypothetical protein
MIVQSLAYRLLAASRTLTKAEPWKMCAMRTLRGYEAFVVFLKNNISF